MLAVAAPVARASPAVQVVAADLACDGKLDRAVLTQGKDSVTVRVRFAKRSRTPQSISFPVGSTQAAICALPASIEEESLDFDPGDDGGVGPLKGFLRSKTCKGLVLGGGDCDPIHLYWDRDSHHVRWWRE